ncbi:hypothetical protein LAD12857_39780 [Lacrimispora amygdalina]|uniref:Uncharacterized protein n=1 Tax=Lacrimispora amygdalina TaxID=253257 RepID=A0A3E2NEY7_9FIRM|nr:hypothetical protein [Clostridium indicum]RFZ79554.1 hypothetical protein DS742_07620 [Clostridium indicum]
MDRCIYCHKEILIAHTLPTGDKEEQLLCCSGECVQKTKDFLNFFKRMKRWFYMGIFLSLGLVLAGTVVAVLKYSQSLMTLCITGGLVIQGISVFFFPFATSESYFLWGIMKTTKLVKFLGVVLIFMGFSLIYYLN